MSNSIRNYLVEFPKLNIIFIATFHLLGCLFNLQDQNFLYIMAFQSIGFTVIYSYWRRDCIAYLKKQKFKEDCKDFEDTYHQKNFKPKYN